MNDLCLEKLFCPNCKKNKNLSEFYFYQGKPKRPCKECKLGYQKEYYQDIMNGLTKVRHKNNI